MSNNDQQEKTEEASPFKLEEARRKGQVARSQDLLSFMMLFVFLLIFSATAADMVGVFAMHAHWWIGNAGSMGADWGYLLGQGSYSLSQIVYALMPLIVALVLIAILANLVFNGPVFSAAPLKPDFKRLHPIQGLKRIFSRRLFVELFKVLVKGVLFSFALYLLFNSLVPRLLDMSTSNPLLVPHAAKELLMQLGFGILVVMAIAALFDMWYSKREFARQMRMSRREQKEEYKRREGDPEMRSKRKSTQQDLLKKASALGQVKDADVIITNPTHYAIALQYRPDTMRAPVILAKGRGLLAHLICKLARKHSVPVLRRPPLARLLHATGQLAAPIPDMTQDDVAQVYRWIISLPGNKVVSV